MVTRKQQVQDLLDELGLLNYSVGVMSARIEDRYGDLAEKILTREQQRGCGVVIELLEEAIHSYLEEPDELDLLERILDKD